MKSPARFPFLVVSLATLALATLAACGDDRTPPANPCASTFETECAGVCVPTTTDPNNCGGCGNRCAAGMTCRLGACTGTALPDMSMPDMGVIRPDLGPPGLCSPSCPSTQRCCGTSCVNRMVASGTDGRADRSFENCGGCGVTCDPVTASACSGTACSCGTLGRPCSAGQQCTNVGGGFVCQVSCGTLGGPCAAGATCCGAGDAAMCINTQLDAANCGTCGNVCAAGTACSAGSCRPVCGSSVCGATELCCADTCVSSGTSNCGACGVSCSGTDICGNVLFPGSGVCCGEEAFLGFVIDCTTPVPDAGTPDLGVVDAGGVDAGDLDAGDVDAGTDDAGL